jgi:hypothetical protein
VVALMMTAGQVDSERDRASSSASPLISARTLFHLEANHQPRQSSASWFLQPQRVRRCGLFPIARTMELTVRGTCRSDSRPPNPPRL